MKETVKLLLSKLILILVNQAQLDLISEMPVTTLTSLRDANKNALPKQQDLVLKHNSSQENHTGL